MVSIYIYILMVILTMVYQHAHTRIRPNLDTQWDGRGNIIIIKIKENTRIHLKNNKTKKTHTTQLENTLLQKIHTQRGEHSAEERVTNYILYLMRILVDTLFSRFLFLVYFFFLSFVDCVVLFCFVGAVCCPVSHKNLPCIYDSIRRVCGKFIYLRLVHCGLLFGLQVCTLHDT